MNSEEGAIEITILGSTFEAPARRTAKGSLYWRFPSNGGSGGGAELDPLGESLPTVLTVNGRDYEFEPVPKRGRSSMSKEVVAFKPFDKARQVRVETHVGEHLLDIFSRVTVRRSGKWHFWFHADQPRPGQQRAASTEPTPKRPSITTSSADRADRALKDILDLVDPHEEPS